MLVVRPPAVVMLPSGILPERKALAPKRLMRAERAVAMRARLEVLRAWRMRSWAILYSMLLWVFGFGLDDGVRFCMVGLEGV